MRMAREKNKRSSIRGAADEVRVEIAAVVEAVGLPDTQPAARLEDVPHEERSAPREAVLGKARKLHHSLAVGHVAQAADVPLGPHGARVGGQLVEFLHPPRALADVGDAERAEPEAERAPRDGLAQRVDGPRQEAKPSIANDGDGRHLDDVDERARHTTTRGRAPCRSRVR